MSVDADQSIGTLTGLINKLMLRHDRNFTHSVLVLDGDVQFQQDLKHVRVSIVSSNHQVAHHVYRIDHQLGRLADNGSLRSQLFKLTCTPWPHTA